MAGFDSTADTPLASRTAKGQVFINWAHIRCAIRCASVFPLAMDLGRPQHRHGGVSWDNALVYCAACWIRIRMYCAGTGTCVRGTDTTKRPEKY